MVFCNSDKRIAIINQQKVTILILIDGFLQSKCDENDKIFSGGSQSLF